MISKELKNVILSALKLDEFDFNEETTAAEVPGWDSLNHVNVILEVEKFFKIRLKNIEILRLKNVGELQKLINSRLHS